MRVLEVPLDLDDAEPKQTKPAASQTEIGVTGTTNWSGRVYAEVNPALQWEQAYGQPGSTSGWGEWERLERTDNAVATALNLIAAPIRDADIEIEWDDEEEEEEEQSKEAGELEEPESEKNAQETDAEEPETDQEGGVSKLLDSEAPPELDAAPDQNSGPTTDEDGGDDAEGLDPEAAEKQAKLEQRQAISSFVKDNLQKWLEPRWPTLLEQIVRYGLGYGFSLHEYVWGTREDDRVPGGQAIYLKKLAQRLPNSIKWDGWIEEDGDLKLVKQAGTKDGKWVDGIELPADKILLATWNRSGNNYSGFSAFRPVWYIGKMRAELLRIVAIGHARESLGVPVIEQDENSSLSSAQLDELQEIVENLVAHEKAGVTLPKGAKLNWVFSPGANKSNVMETWRALGVAILETVQAQQVALGTGETGSRSVGEVHDGTKNAFIAGIRAWIEGVLNGVGEQPYTGLVRKLVALNFGEQESYPTIKLVIKKGELPAQEFANALKTLSDAGAIHLSESDENPIRERLGLAPFDPLERAAVVAKKEADKAAQLDAMRQAQGQPPSNGGPPNAQNLAPKGKEAPDKDQEKDPKPQKFADRWLRPSEQVLNLADITNFLDTGRDRFEAMVKPIVDGMIRDAVEDVREAMKDGDPTELSKLKLDTKLLSKAIEVFVENARAFGFKQALKESGISKDYSPTFDKAKDFTFEDSMQLADTFGLAEEDFDQPGETTEELLENLVTAQTKMMTQRIAERTKQALWDEAVNAVRQGKNADAAIDRVLKQLEDAKTLRKDAGVVLGRSFSMGREQFLATADGIDHLELSCALESSSCSYCRSQDGRTFRPGSEEHREFTPPLSNCDGMGNCRCAIVAVYSRA